jgi:quinoprotein glucose dehydrogenase
MRSRWIIAGIGLATAGLTAIGSAALTVGVAEPAAAAPQAAGAAGVDWPVYRHDHAGTGSSPLTQINKDNVARIAEAWTYSLAAATPPASGRGGAAGPNSQATPIVVGGVMYLPAADRVVALNPADGKEIWRHLVTGGVPSRRGVAYWPGEGGSGPRVIFTSGRRLMALNARTGALDTGFGDAGSVDMVVPYNSVPLVHRNVVVVGANSPPGTGGGIGNARAYDARTGAKLWEFSSVPQPGEVGHDTWEGDSWKNRLGVNAWPFYFTVDEARGLLFVPLASPIGGAYGGDRKGANLFGNSVVAVDLQSGKYRWHFQTIHHDLWDADPPAPPSLFEVNQGGRTVPALALTTKSGYLYILNRETGQPIFGVEERPVPRSDVPGEVSFPTQPIPVKPPALARVSYAAEDLVTAADTTPEHAAACAELVAKAGGVQNAGPFTPWMHGGEGTTATTTLVFPGGLGGANWGGTAFDRNTGLVFVVTQDDGALGWMEKAKADSPVPYEKGFPGRRTFDVEIGGTVWPCQKPPWGRLTAVNASTGEIAWQRPLGVTDQLPAARQNTGRPALAGPIATAGGLLFVASTDDNRFRALDARTGAELWVTRLERRGNADPLTYQAGGKQYVAVAATDKLMVYALP